MNQIKLWKRMLIIPVAVGGALAAFSTSVNAVPTPVTYVVTPSVVGNGTIDPPTPLTVEKNDTPSFALDPDEHHHFVDVTGTCRIGTATDIGGGTWNYITGMIKDDCTVIANFAIDQFSLTVNNAGTGSGTVTSSPAGIDCGVDCSEDYDYNTVVTLTATPEGDDIFASWSGDADCSDGIVTMDAAKSCTATFTGVYTITASASPVAGGGVSCTPNPVVLNSSSNCTISTNPHYTLDNVTGTCGGTLVGDTYTTDAITADCTVIANFAIDRFSLRVATAGTGSGTVTSSPAGIDCGVDCSEDYDYNTEVTLTALAVEGSTFIDWSGDGCTGTDECSVTMDQAREITATFDGGFPWPTFLPAIINQKQ